MLENRIVGRSGLGAVLAAIVLAAGCGQQQSAVEMARAAADEGDRVRAIDYYQAHLAGEPDDFDARLEYTLLLGENWAFHGGDRRPIVEGLQILFAAAPSNLRVKELYAMMLVREGQAAAEARRFEGAEESYLSAIDVHPDVGTPNYHLGVLYEQWGRPQEAFESYIAGALKRPPIPDLYLRLGMEYLQRDDLDRAINTLELVEELRGTSTYLLPRMHCGLAEAFHQRGDQELARMHLEQAQDGCELSRAGG